MKRLWIVLCVAILCLALFAACGGQIAADDNGTDPVTTAIDDSAATTIKDSDGTTAPREDNTQKPEQTTAPVPNGEPNTAFVDDRPNGNNTKPDTFN